MVGTKTLFDWLDPSRMYFIVATHSKIFLFLFVCCLECLLCATLILWLSMQWEGIWMLSNSFLFSFFNFKQSRALDAAILKPAIVILGQSKLRRSQEYANMWNVSFMHVHNRLVWVSRKDKAEHLTVIRGLFWVWVSTMQSCFKPHFPSQSRVCCHSFCCHYFGLVLDCL